MKANEVQAGAAAGDARSDLRGRRREAAAAAGRRPGDADRARRSAACTTGRWSIRATDAIRTLLGLSPRCNAPTTSSRWRNTRRRSRSFDGEDRPDAGDDRQIQADAAALPASARTDRQADRGYARRRSAAHGTGSQLNLLTSQDRGWRCCATLEFDHNSLIEAQEHAGFDQVPIATPSSSNGRRNLSQELVTARNNLDTATAQLEKAAKHTGSRPADRRRTFGRADHRQAVGRLGARRKATRCSR